MGIVILAFFAFIIFLILIDVIRATSKGSKDEAFEEKKKLVYDWQKLFEIRKNPDENPATIWMKLDLPKYQDERERLVKETPLNVILDAIEREKCRLRKMGLDDETIKDRLKLPLDL